MLNFGPEALETDMAPGYDGPPNKDELRFGLSRTRQNETIRPDISAPEKISPVIKELETLQNIKFLLEIKTDNVKNSSELAKTVKALTKELMSGRKLETITADIQKILKEIPADSSFHKAFLALGNINATPSSKLIAMAKVEDKGITDVAKTITGSESMASNVRIKAVLGIFQEYMGKADFEKVCTHINSTNKAEIRSSPSAMAIINSVVENHIRSAVMGIDDRESALSKAAEIIQRSIANFGMSTESGEQYLVNHFDLTPEKAKEKIEAKTTKNVIKVKAVGMTSPKELIKGPNLAEKLKTKSLQENVKEEMKIVLETVKRIENTPTKMRRRAFEKAFQELLVLGKFDEAEIKKTLDKYDQVIGKDPESAENAAFFGAFKKAIEHKKHEIAYVRGLKDKAQEEYKQIPGPKNNEAETIFVENRIKETLIGRLLGKRKPEFSEAQIKEIAGRTHLYTPAIEMLSAEGKNLSPLLPVLVASDIDMATLTGAESPAKAPRGEFYRTKDRVNGSIDVLLMQYVTQKENPDIAMHEGSFRHEMYHWILTASRDNLRGYYIELIKTNTFNSILKKFDSDLAKDTSEGVKEIRAGLGEMFMTLIESPEKSDFSDLPNVNAATREKFLEFLLKGGGKKMLEGSRFAIQKDRYENSSTMEELVTHGADMQVEMGLNVLGIKPEEYKANDSRTISTLGVMRVYNSMFSGSPEGYDFYKRNEEYFTNKLLTQLDGGSRSWIDPKEVSAMVRRIWEEALETTPEAVNAGAIIDLLKLNFEDIQKDLALNGKDVIADALTPFIGMDINSITADIDPGNLDTLLEAINSSDLEQLVKNDLVSLVKQNQWKDVLAYFRLNALTATQGELKGYGEYGVNTEDPALIEKKTGFSSQARKFYDFNPKFGQFGLPNFKYSDFEAKVPIIGPLFQNIADSLNITGRNYIHVKDAGPFHEIPFLNYKYLRDGLGWFLGDEKHRLDGSDPMEGISAMFGINLFRNKAFNKERADSFKEREAKGLPPRWYDIKLPYRPEAVVQPGAMGTYELVITILMTAMKNAGLGQGDQQTILSVIGGLSPTRGIEIKVADFREVDEYRASKAFVEFLPQIAKRFNKEAEWKEPNKPGWTERWTKYMEEDAFDYYETGSKGAKLSEEKIDISGNKNLGRVRKGTMTRNLLDDITKAIYCDELKGGKGERKDAFNKKDKFLEVGRAMMSADIWKASKSDPETPVNQRGRYTIEDLIQELVYVDNDPRMFVNRDDPANKALHIQEFLDKPTINIKYGDGEEDFVTIETKDAKEFIAYYYLARMRSITDLGVWGMSRKEKTLMRTAQGGVEEVEENVSCVSDPSDPSRHYDMNLRRRFSNREDTKNVMMMSQDLVDPLHPMTRDMWEMFNGKHKEKEFEGKKAEFVEWKVENMTHDVVTGALDGAEWGRKLAFDFTTKIRQTEYFRDMSKAKKDLWEGTNNIDDSLRIIALLYSIATVLFAPLLFSPGLLVGLIAWSMTVSPFINRSMEGWKQRDISSNEILATMRDQYAPMFYSLADESKYHSVNDIRHAFSTYNQVKNTWKRVLVDLSKSGDPNSNVLSRRVNGLLGKIL